MAADDDDSAAAACDSAAAANDSASTVAATAVSSCYFGCESLMRVRTKLGGWRPSLLRLEMHCRCLLRPHMSSTASSAAAAPWIGRRSNVC